MSKFGLYPTDMQISCHSFQCYNRAAYFLGKEDAPRGTEYYVCEECAQELIEHVVNNVAFIKKPIEKPAEAAEEDSLLGKNVADWTVAELKEKAAGLDIHSYKSKNKAELVDAIREATDHE